MPVPAGYKMLESGFWTRVTDQSGPYVFDGGVMRLAAMLSVDPPAAPVMGLAVAGNQTVTAPYSAPLDDGGSAITSYDAALVDEFNNVIAILTGVPNPVVFTGAQGVQAGVKYKVRVRAVNAVRPGPYSEPTNAVVPTAAQLRVVTVNNHINSGTVSSVGNDSWIGTLDYFIGSGDVYGLVLSWDGWYVNAGTYADAPVAYTIRNTSVKDTTLQNPAAVTFNGNASKVVNPGDADVQADILLPASMGMTKFSIGQRLLVTVEIRLAATGQALVGQAGRFIQANANNSIGWFNSANTTIGNINGNGAFTVTGIALSAASNSAVPMPKGLGYFASGDPTTLFGFGDSIFFGFTDITTFSPKGYGIFQRVLIGTGADNQLLAGLNFCITGITLAGLTSNPKITEYAKYCKDAIDEIGTNTFGTTGTVTSATVVAALRTLWSGFQAKGIRNIHRTKLGPRTPAPSVWTLADGSDQTTIANGWNTGQAVDIFNNTDLPVELAAGRIKTLIPMNFWRNGTNPILWVANGTPGYSTDDGLHPKDPINAALALEIRTTVNANP